MKNIHTHIRLLLITAFAQVVVFATEPYFYDSDNSCSLGCSCSWDVLQPKNSAQLGKSTPLSPGDDFEQLTRSILIDPGETIKFVIKGMESDGVAFTGFSIIGGSFDGKSESSIPMKYEITINGVSASTGTFKETKERQSVYMSPVVIHNHDVLGLKFISGYSNGQKIGVTYLTPNGGH